MSPMKLFSQDMLGMLGAKDETRKRYFSNETATDETATDSELGNKAMESAGVGGAIGVTAGAILATLAARSVKTNEQMPKGDYVSSPG
jgi:hypothetical protein